MRDRCAVILSVWHTSWETDWATKFRAAVRVRVSVSSWNRYVSPQSSIAQLTVVYNASLQSGYFPHSQKLARVTARLKKPSMDPYDLNSFRPISNLTFLCKIVERVVTEQFTSHAALNGLFPERQSAYRQFHSTESAVLALHNNIVSAIDQRWSHWSSTFGPELCIRYCRPRLIAVDPWVSIFGHRTCSHWYGSTHTWRTVHRCLLPSLVRLSRYH